MDSTDSEASNREIRLLQNPDGRWTARDLRLDVTAQGETRSVALDTLDAVDGPVVTSADVADAVDCSRETACRKLRALGDRGAVASQETAGRVVWWRTERDAEADANGIDPDDPFWDLEPGASGESDVSEHVLPYPPDDSEHNRRQ